MANSNLGNIQKMADKFMPPAGYPNKKKKQSKKK